MKPTVITGLVVDGAPSPIGLGNPHPRFGWRIETDRPWLQKTCRIRVSSRPDLLAGDPDLWDSGPIRTRLTTSPAYDGARLLSRQSCHWDVELEGEDGIRHRSAPAVWEVGLLSEADFNARFIGLRRPAFETLDHRPTPYLRRIFQLSRRPDRARLYVTAAGCHDTTINGQPIGPDRFRPGWTDYAHTLTIDCHDVTGLLVAGRNVIASVVGEGWYAGYIGFEWRRELWGRQIGLCAQLEMEIDGHRQTIVTDEGWEGRHGGLLASDMLNGEVVDFRMEPHGWQTAGDDGAGWEPVIPIPPPKGVRRGRIYPTVRCQQVLAPLRIEARANGDLVADFGENIGGNVSAILDGDKGRIVRFQHSEALNDDGSPYLDSLHSARSASTVILDGETRSWRPRFAHHGFRYVTISGLPDLADLRELRAHRLEAAVPRTGELTTSDPRLDRIVAMARRTHHSHLFEVMMDCIQRDERFGWLADPVGFLPSAFYLSDMRAFLGKWLDDIRLAQHEDGVIPRMVPEYPAYPARYGAGWGSAVFEGLAGGFSDAFVRMVWEIYRFTGDLDQMREDLPRIEALMSRLMAETGDGIWEAAPSTIIGADHIEDPPLTPAPFVATASLCRSLDLAARMAGICGYTERQKAWTDAARGMRAAFRRRFLGHDGLPEVETQSALTFVSAFDLAAPETATAVRERLIARVRADGRLRTGIFTTPLVLHELTRGGASDLACEILQSDAERTFGFWAEHGLTTIPERWDALDARGFPIREPANSLSHVALGSVVEWIFAQAGGLTPTEPGWQRIRFAPGLVTKLAWAESRVWTPNGAVQARWENREGTIVADIDVPPNCLCDVIAGGVRRVLHSGSHRLTMNTAN